MPSHRRSWWKALPAVGLLVASALVTAQSPQPSRPQYGMELGEAWIPMPDGVRLAADLYMPTGAPAGTRFPVLLEYLPYRKTEARGRNWPLYSYFVTRGYAVARVDIRGTGNSEGVLVPHEYSDIEHDDGEVVIEWLSKQPWSTGNVGMFGISWGGFNAIQMAARNPPALEAFIAVDATEDLYQEDVHYIDGIMHLDSWEMSQDLDNARPGAPGYVMDEAYFRNRFDTPPWMLTWKRHQRDGPFWDRASMRGRQQQIRVPGFHIGGWFDGYRDSIPRMLEHAGGPVKAMIGPWSHAWPHDPYPKPGMEWRHEAVRWFDHWLKGVDTGVMQEPRFAVFVREWHPPGPYLETAPGHWRWEDGWPIPRVAPRTMYLSDDHTLVASAGARATHRLRYVPGIGIEAGGPVMWWGDVAHDQRPSDTFALVYESAPLDADLEILGLPQALVTVGADAPRADWFARLSDVAPDGRVTQVAGAGFNGTHRNSAREPELIEPGRPFPLAIEMHFTSWVFPKGHRIRFALANAQWPMFWPTPHAMTTTLAIGGAEGARLVLPVVPPGTRAAPAPAFLPPEPGPELPGFQSLETGTPSGYGEVSEVRRNPQTGEVTVVATNTGGDRYPWGTERYQERIEHTTSAAHPEATTMKGTHRMEVDLPGRTLAWEAALVFRSDLEAYHYDYVRRVYENGKLLREKAWTERFPRDP
ncbi:MAG: CocE/NonD family hydrolase [Vicinamibacterales bacterium]